MPHPNNGLYQTRCARTPVRNAMAHLVVVKEASLYKHK